jgi:hypothetical protein
MLTNTPLNIAVADDGFDPFAEASAPKVPTYDLFGLVEINAWACALQKGVGKVPFDPTNPNHKRFTAIDVFIQPLAEIEIKYPKTCEEHWVAEFPEWAKITLPSIKACGIENVREINGMWCRVARVPNGKRYEKKDKDGNPTGQFADETTFKFVEFYSTEDACRAAYIAAGGQVAKSTNGGAPAGVPTTPVVDPTEAEKATAYAFLKVIVGNAAKGKASVDDAKLAVDVALAQYPTVEKFYKADSAETLDLIKQTLAG